MLFLLFIASVIPILLICANAALFKKHSFSRNKPSAFECGFDTILPARTPFSLSFYLISIVFLIFDIEIALILPIPFITAFSLSYFMNFLVSLFMLILFVGLIFEWKEGALKWLN